MTLRLKIPSITAQEAVATAGALSTIIYSSRMTDSEAGTYTLADPGDNYGNHGLYKYITNTSDASHTLTPANFVGGTSMTVPATADVYLIWQYGGDDSFSGNWSLIRFTGSVSIT